MMTTATLWVWPEDGRAVVELGDGDTALELVVYLDAERSHAAWVWSHTGAFLAWVAVGVA